MPGHPSSAALQSGWKGRLGVAAIDGQGSDRVGYGQVQRRGDPGVRWIVRTPPSPFSKLQTPKPTGSFASPEPAHYASPDSEISKPSTKALPAAGYEGEGDAQLPLELQAQSLRKVAAESFYRP